MIGIYKITNKITGECYIGQSIHIEERFKQHKYDIKRKNTILYQKMREFGLKNFTFEIIEECKPSQLNEREIYWISYYDSYYNGYNMNFGGLGKIFDNKLIFKLWDEGKSIKEIQEQLHLSQTTIRNYLQGYKNYSAKNSKQRGGILAYKTNNNLKINSIYQLDLKGNFIQKWNSTKEIERKLNISSSSIGKVLNGKRKTAGGYIWSQTLENIKPQQKKGKRKVSQLNDNKEIIKIYNSIKEASIKNGIDSSLISRVCKNGNRAGGFYWKYID